jgi:hypothetical protein
MNCSTCGVRYEQSQVTGICDLCLPKQNDKLLAKLKRFEEREPLVQALLTALCECPNDAAVDEMCRACLARVDALRDFKL